MLLSTSHHQPFSRSVYAVNNPSISECATDLGADLGFPTDMMAVVQKIMATYRPYSCQENQAVYNLRSEMGSQQTSDIIIIPSYCFKFFACPQTLAVSKDIIRKIECGVSCYGNVLWSSSFGATSPTYQTIAGIHNIVVDVHRIVADFFKLAHSEIRTVVVCRLEQIALLPCFATDACHHRFWRLIPHARRSS